MKTNFTQRLFLILASTMISLTATTQNIANLFSNSSFDQGNDSWAITDMFTEINTENIYGGRIAGNRVAEIDAQAGLRQKFAVVSGKIYTVTFKASRRTTGSVPPIVGVTVRIVGSTTGNVYYTSNSTYSNTTFGYVLETKTFFIHANAPDQIMVMEMVAYSNNSTLGVIVDDVQMTMSNNAAVPVLWKSFTAEVKNQQVLLNWKTGDERNNKHFVVERSANGNVYDSIGTIDANAFQTYTFTDTRLLSGTSFYRVRQVDLDGTAKYSKVAIVRGQAGSNDLKLFPTVAGSVVNFAIKSQDKSDATVLVYDASGRVVMQLQRSLGTGVNQQSVDVTPLREGNYFFTIRNSAGTVNITKAFYKAS